MAKRILFLMRGVGALVFFILLSPLFASAQGSAACDYHVSRELGASDANTGSLVAPWASVSHVLAQDAAGAFAAGDVICFRRGDEFFRQNNGVLGSSGMPQSPIVYTNYGDEQLALPVLSMSFSVPEGGESWSGPDVNNIYSYSESGSVGSNLWDNGRPQEQVDSLTPTLQPGQWHRASGTIYYRPISGSPGDVRFAKNGVLFSMIDLQHRVFDGLAFEYITEVIFARSDTLTVNNIVVRNSHFANVERGVSFENQVGSGLETHTVTVEKNIFDTVRFAARFSAKNQSLRFHNIDIFDNVASDIALEGDYAKNDNSPDIEVFSLQNIWNSRISGNRVSTGVKKSQGFVNGQDEALFSVGISVWVHPTQLLKGNVIEKNFFDGLGRGVIFGAGVAMALEDNLFANNIIANSDMGFRLNSADASVQKTRLYHNTLYGNDINFSLNSNTAGYRFFNNLSVAPLSLHLDVAQHTAQQADFDNNLYVPEGSLFRYLGNTYNFSGWQAQIAQEAASLTASDAGFLLAPDNTAAAYQLSALSAAADLGQQLSDVQDDYINADRDFSPDAGAFEVAGDNVPALTLIHWSALIVTLVYIRRKAIWGAG